MKTIDIGILQDIRHHDGGSLQTFDDLWRVAALAEDLGFDHIWLADSVTLLDRARGDCLAVMGALAAKTSKIKIGTVPLLAALRNPVLLAHSLATLDLISNGRLMLAVSVGPVAEYMEHQFRACGVPSHEKAGRLSECLQIMRQLWTHNKINFEGKYYQLKEVGILPPPLQKPGIPIWIAANQSEKAFKRVARLADGWVTTAPTVEKFAADRKVIAAFASEVGRPSDVMPATLYAALNVHENGEKAREEGWAWMETFFRQPRSKLANFLGIFGTPEECSRFLRAYVNAGLTALIVRFASANQKLQMEYFLKEVKPRLMA